MRFFCVENDNYFHFITRQCFLQAWRPPQKLAILMAGAAPARKTRADMKDSIKRVY
jgi:hypothetical protein